MNGNHNDNQNNQNGNVVDLSSRVPVFQAQLLPRPKIPTVPHENMRCINCSRWLSEQSKKYVATNNGLLPFDVVSRGNPIGPLLQQSFDAAPCTLNPVWTIQPSDHWCWQFEGVRDVEQSE